MSSTSGSLLRDLPLRFWIMIGGGAVFGIAYMAWPRKPPKWIDKERK